ncbi:MAG TPA: hypothetical protein VM535_00300 [Candidatus Saccharimonadales bacterium]|nr:hypothetical protein [Candidatus Saccharimonadales bacterium]
MLYKELKRANDLDAAIAGLHEHLADLYKERASLLRSTSAPTETDAKPAKPHKINVEGSYYALRSKWNSLGANFPDLKKIDKKILKALDLQQKLEANNPDLRDKLTIVAVPPFKTLEKILAGDSLAAQSFLLDDEIFQNVRKTTSWSLVIMVDATLCLPIYGLKGFLERREFIYDGHDCRGMGLNELIAAELQGVSVVFEDSWTVLLKGQTKPKDVLCATYENGLIVFSTEDTDCLLGENYLGLTIKAH